MEQEIFMAFIIEYYYDIDACSILINYINEYLYTGLYKYE